ncbi:MAG: hypothetical protein OXN23_05895 [Gammaproteobacteria bacterium]|nr:hypothetical protein [Gammaproteobacteria bacterium]MDE0302327.1 hypothetical protein [Gammaproteobacteria bacterium]
MAKMTIRSTYTFDVETVQKLDRLAEHWSTSKSEALRRSIDRVAEQTLRNCEDAIAALEELQRRMAEAGVDTEKWVKEIREERRASSRRSLRWIPK